MLHPVVLLGPHPVQAAAAPALPPVGRDGNALDVAGVRDRDDHVLVGDQVLHREVAFLAHYLRAPVVSEPFQQVVQLTLEDVEPLRLGRQDSLQLLDQLADLSELRLQLVDLESGQPGEAHVQDGLALLLRKLEPLAQCGVCGGHVLRLANDLHDLVDVVDGDLEPLEDVLARLRLTQVVLRAPRDDLVAMVDEVPQQLLEVEDLRLTVHQGEHDHPEGGLHLRVLVELVEDDRRVGVALELDHDPHTVPVRFVAQVRDVGDLLAPHQLHDLLDEPRLVDLERDLRDHDPFPARLGFLNERARAHHDAAAARLVAVLDPVPSVDKAAGGEVRSLHVRAQRRDVTVRLVDQVLGSSGDLADVVRRDVRGHADRDARRAVDEQVGEPRRQHRRVLQPVVEVGHPRDRVLLDVIQHRNGELGEARLGVPIGRGAVTVDRSEVPLSIDQRVTQREVLHHAHERVVDRRVAVRVVLAQHVSHHRRALLVRAARLKPELVHRVQDAPVHRLEPVPHVGQGALDNHAHRVVDERVLHLILYQTGEDAFALIGCRHVFPETT